MSSSILSRFLCAALVVTLAHALAGCAGSASTKKSDQASTAAITGQAAALGKAFKERDFKAIAAAMPPKLIETSGGEERYIASLKTVFETMAKAGMKVDSVRMGEPSGVVEEGGQLQCTVAQTTDMSGARGAYRAESTWLGISDDNGLTWHFIDCSRMDSEAFRKVVPHVSSQLVIPKTEGPKVLRGQ